MSIWIDALFPRRFVVMHQALLPFCLGHAAALTAADSPFITNKPINFDDLLVAVYFCSRDGWDTLHLLADPKWEARMKKECRKWGKASAKFNFRESVEAVKEYIDAFTKCPERWEGCGGGRSVKLRSHWIIATVTALQARIGLDERRAWTIPLALGSVYLAAYGESQGDDSLMSEEEIKIRDRFDKEQVELEAKEKAEQKAEQKAGQKVD